MKFMKILTKQVHDLYDSRHENFRGNILQIRIKT